MTTVSEHDIVSAFENALAEPYPNAHRFEFFGITQDDVFWWAEYRVWDQDEDHPRGNIRAGGVIQGVQVPGAAYINCFLFEAAPYRVKVYLEPQEGQ